MFENNVLTLNYSYAKICAEWEIFEKLDSKEKLNSLNTFLIKMQSVNIDDLSIDEIDNFLSILDSCEKWDYRNKIESFKKHLIQYKRKTLIKNKKLPTFPTFKFHPNPLETGNAIEKEFICVCCEKEKNYAYKGPIFSADDSVDQILEDNSLCLDCIADGSAAKKLEAEFIDCYNAHKQCSNTEALSELSNRTPGYNSWQMPIWVFHCNEPCEFHGEFTKNELMQLCETIAYPEDENYYDPEQLKNILKSYKPGSEHTFFKFVCIKCNSVIAHEDML